MAWGEGGRGRERLARRAPPAHKNAINVTNAVYSPLAISSPSFFFAHRPPSIPSSHRHASHQDDHCWGCSTTLLGLLSAATHLGQGGWALLGLLRRGGEGEEGRGRLAAARRQPMDRDKCNERSVFTTLHLSPLSFLCAPPPIHPLPPIHTPPIKTITAGVVCPPYIQRADTAGVLTAWETEGEGERDSPPRAATP